MSSPSFQTPPAVQLHPNQHGEVLEIQVATQGVTVTSPSTADTVLLVVGEVETPISVPKHLLMTISFFERMFSSRFPCKETIENKMFLPEDEVPIWSRALEFLNTGKYFPYFKVSHTDGESQSDPPPTLKLHLPLLVANEEGRMVEWDGSDDRYGVEVLSDFTYDLLEDQVLLLRLAEKYLWASLMNACIQKISLFPVGRCGFSLLLDHGTNIFQNCEDFQLDPCDRDAGLNPLDIWHQVIDGPRDLPGAEAPGPIHDAMDARIELFELINRMYIKIGSTAWKFGPYRYVDTEGR